MADTKELLDNYIYPNIDREDLLRDLSPKAKGPYISLTCPQCKKPQAFIYKNGTQISCNRKNNCNYSKSLWDFIQERGKLTNQDTLKELARLANYSLPSSGLSYENYAKDKKRADLYETAHALFCQTLWEDKEPGKSVIKYLTEDRGYSQEQIEKFELGCRPDPSTLQAYLKNKGFTEEEVKEGLEGEAFSYDKKYRLTIPYRDPQGRLKGFASRRIDKGEPKYLYTKGMKRDTLFNFDKARLQENGSLVIVEGFLDALVSHYALESKSFGVVATGGNALSEKYQEDLKRYGIEKLYLLFDNDEAGIKYTSDSVRKASGFRVLIASLPKDIKDPDELIRKQGGAELEKCLLNAQSVGSWAFQGLLSKHGIQSIQSIQKNKKDDLYYDAIEVLGTIAEPYERDKFILEVSSALQIDKALLDSKVKAYRDRKAGEDLRAGIETLKKELDGLIQEGTEAIRVYRPLRRGSDLCTLFTPGLQLQRKSPWAFI